MSDSLPIAPGGNLESAREGGSADWVLGRNPAVREIARHAQRAASADCTVLISGETGTGKELWATLIHERGPRAAKPFIPVNCAALTVTLAESQLFGHEKGAFTGAVGRSAGVFRAAEGGTVFLDEVGEMPMELQPKLLRVLQQREVTPVGSAHPVPVDVQIVAATNRDLEDEVAEGRFREDLYLSAEHGRAARAAAALSRGRHPRVHRVLLAALRLALPAAQRGSRMPTRSSSFANSLGRATCASLPMSSNNPMSSIVRPACRRPAEPSSRPTSRCRSWIWPSCGSRPFSRRSHTTRGHKGRAAKLLGVHANTLTRMLAQIEAECDAFPGMLGRLKPRRPTKPR